MHADSKNPAALRNEARQVAAVSTEPFMAWSELKRWSLGKGPAATRVAVMEFMEQHGRKPEAAAIIPEISRLALQMPEPERKEMLSLANRPFAPASGFERTISPISSSIGTTFPKKKEQKEMPAPHPDIARMMEQRDAIFHVNRGALGAPREGKKAGFAPALPITRRDFTPVLSAGHGHALVHSLSERLSFHGHEEHVHAENPGERAFALAKKRHAAKKRAARKAARPARKKTISRAPARVAKKRKARK